MISGNTRQLAALTAQASRINMRIRMILIVGELARGGVKLEWGCRLFSLLSLATEPSHLRPHLLYWAM